MVFGTGFYHLAHFKVHLYCKMHQDFIAFQGRITVNCMSILYLIYPIIS